MNVNNGSKLKINDLVKRQHINITISPESIKEIDREMLRLGIGTRSRIIDLIIGTYSQLPLEGSN